MPTSGSGPRRPDSSLRDDATALANLVALLSPRSATSGGPGTSYGVVPGLAKPRYLLPTEAWPISDSLIFRVGAEGSRQQQTATRLLGPALRTGLFRVARRQVTIPDGTPDDPSLLTWLRREFNRDDLVMGLAMGPPRPNRKPILQLLGGDGLALGFGKLGTDELTDQLVRAEGAFLEGYQPVDIGVPKVLRATTWHGHQLLLLSPLPVGHGGGKSSLAFTAAEIRAIAQRLPLERQEVAASAWWETVDQRRRQAGTSRSILAAAAVEALAVRLDGVSWTFGAWHGDLTPWNAERVDAALYVWDWERAGGPVPLGFDAAHAAFQVASLQQGRTVTDALAQAEADLAPLLGELGIPSVEQRLLLDCYLLELSLRMIEAERTGTLGSLGTTVDTALTALAASR